MTKVSPAIRALVADVIGESPLEPGKRYIHPEDGLIEVTRGQFWGERGLSNFWYWTVLATGEEHHGYGGQWPAVEDGQDS